MKVLIIHQHFKTPQGGGPLRSYYLAKALVENGFQAVVITGHNGDGCRVEQIDGIHVHYLPVAYDNRFGFYRRLYSFYRFAVKAVKISSQHRDADVCYAISTPLTAGLAARWVSRKYGVPYIFEVGDLWPDAPIQMGFIRNTLIKRFLYKMERAIYERASAIVALSDPIRQAIASKIPEKDIFVIPNMADTRFFQPEKKDPVLQQKFAVQGKFVVSYMGALGIANGLQHFLDCAAAAQAGNMPVRFLLCGDGAMLDEMQAYAARLELRNLSVVPFQNRSGIREIMNVTDANFVSYLPVKILETGSPNKYFDGLAAGKLTVVNFGGWIEEEIRREQCGVFVDPENANDFPAKIKPFVDDPELMQAFSGRARHLAQKYSRITLGNRYLELVGRFDPEAV